MTNFLPVTDLDKEHERIVLSGMFASSIGVSDALAILRKEDFYYDAHQKIFAAIISVWEHSGVQDQHIDAGLVYLEIVAKSWLEDIGGSNYLCEVIESDRSGMYLESRAEIVRQSSIRRQIFNKATEILHECCDPRNLSDDLLGKAQAGFLAIGSEQNTNNTRSIRTVVGEVNTEIDRRVNSPDMTGVPSGLVDLDSKTGGFQNGNLIVLAARPSVGKTALAVNLCVEAARHHFAPLFISVEQPGQELVMRMMCGASGVSSTDILRGRLTQVMVTDLLHAGQSIAGLPVWINDSASQKVRNISAIARRLIARENIKLILIDYLQLLDSDDKRIPRHEQVGQMTRSLKILAREANIPIILLAQLNREAEDALRPKLSHLRESGSVEQDADVVLFLHREHQQNHDMPAEQITLIVAKQRQGPCGDVHLIYRKSAMTFENAGTIGE